MNGDIVKTVQNILEELSALKTKVEFVKRLSDELNTETNCKISKLQEYARFIETVSKAIEPARVVNQPRSLNQTVLNNEKRSIAHQQSWQQSHCISGPLDNSTDLLYPDVKIEVNQTAAQHQFGVDSQAGNIALPTTTATASDALKVEAFENEQVANSRPKDGTKERATKETSEEIGAWDLEMEVNDDDLQTDQDDLMCAPCQLSFTSFTSFIEHSSRKHGGLEIARIAGGQADDAVQDPDYFDLEDDSRSSDSDGEPAAKKKRAKRKKTHACSSSAADLNSTASDISTTADHQSTAADDQTTSVDHSTSADDQSTSSSKKKKRSTAGKEGASPSWKLTETDEEPGLDTEGMDLPAFMLDGSVTKEKKTRPKSSNPSSRKKEVIAELREDRRELIQEIQNLKEGWRQDRLELVEKLNQLTDSSCRQMAYPVELYQMSMEEQANKLNIDLEDGAVSWEPVETVQDFPRLKKSLEERSSALFRLMRTATRPMEFVLKLFAEDFLAQRDAAKEIQSADIQLEKFYFDFFESKKRCANGRTYDSKGNELVILTSQSAAVQKAASQSRRVLAARCCEDLRRKTNKFTKLLLKRNSKVISDDQLSTEVLQLMESAKNSESKLLLTDYKLPDKYIELKKFVEEKFQKK